MCNVKISDSCDETVIMKTLDDGREVCAACLPFVNETHDMHSPYEERDPIGHLPPEMHWDIKPDNSQAQLPQTTPVRSLNAAGHPDD